MDDEGSINTTYQISLLLPVINLLFHELFSLSYQLLRTMPSIASFTIAAVCRFRTSCISLPSISSVRDGEVIPSTADLIQRGIDAMGGEAALIRLH
jgi:hypothetical protein